MSTAKGMKIATAAVLLINPEIIETVNKKINMVIHFLLRQLLIKISANTSKIPVFTRALLIIKIAPIVITAGLLNPLMDSCQLKISNKRRMPIAPMAVTSKGSTSSIKNITITRSTETRINISIVILLSPKIDEKGERIK